MNTADITKLDSLLCQAYKELSLLDDIPHDNREVARAITRGKNLTGRLIDWLMDNEEQLTRVSGI